MSHSIHLENLKKQGFFIIPNVLSQNDVEALKDKAIHIFKIYGGGAIRPTIFLKEKLISKIFFQEKISNLLKEIFSDDEIIYLYPNITIRNNLYINWHTDDLFFKEKVQDENSLPEFYMFNIYLQDNSREAGGGLDVMPGTHRLNKEVKKEIILSADEAANYSILSKAGDLIVFDYRVIHRGTMPITERNSHRLALQWTVSTSDKLANIYLTYLLSRVNKKIHISDFTQHRDKAFFEDIPKVNYPDSFNSEGIHFFKDRIKFIDVNHYIKKQNI